MEISIERLDQFQFERTLNQDPLSHSISILGTLPENSTPNRDGHEDKDPSSEQKRYPAIVQIIKTPLDSTGFGSLHGRFEKIETIGRNDIYYWLLGWLGGKRTPDVKITVVENATDVHIRKFTKQPFSMVRETPQIYLEVIKPYIEAFPPSRLQWVYNILAHETEEDKILFEDPSPTDGFIILPDLKWDGKTMSTFYIQAIVHPRDIYSLRDIRKRHLPMLRNIRKQAIKVSQEKYGLTAGQLRLFVHYQPSYYHFHVHIVTLELSGQSNANVGLAHLLDDIISLLELEPDNLEDGQATFARMSMTYTIGQQHGLHDALVSRQTSLLD
ncbi:Scavenger mRNA-decapping enzyme DcpS [Ceratobasidium theobromae]|uniref:m7GpppX diphosphatase n=1 Tax=Ceratobasidium theobromae TaxID=1582974 RepID=A0A5N5QEE3_9AGAM|nr:Scavenger mRNA-decapping enzyme DcpS [Ceratobasidium theobromae]